MKKYDVIVAYLDDNSCAAVFVVAGYHAESAWQAVMGVMVKREVASIRDDRLLRVDVVRSQ